jgi:hypothetical protein
MDLIHAVEPAAAILARVSAGRAGPGPAICHQLNRAAGHGVDDAMATGASLSRGRNAPTFSDLD